MALAGPRRYDPEYEAILRGDPGAYCGARSAHMDHIVPVVAGGIGEWENLTAACMLCNKQKHGGSLLSFLLRRRMKDEFPPQPMVGVRWRRDTLCWDARVHAGGRKHLLGAFVTAEDACAAVKEWHRMNPDVTSPKKHRQRQRAARIKELWAQKQPMRVIAEDLGITVKALSRFMDRMRERGEDLPRVGRGAPGRKRPSRAGINQTGCGYRQMDATKMPWLVQVQSNGRRLRARFDTEAEAAAAVAAFREESRNGCSRAETD